MANHNPERSSHPEIKKAKNFEVKTVGNAEQEGFSYIIYFPDATTAAKAAEEFWVRFSDSNSGSNYQRKKKKINLPQEAFGLGEWRPSKHPIIFHKDVTTPGSLNAQEMKEYPGMSFKMEFAGRSGGLSPEAQKVLRSLGFIE